jgi:hypothetical protein
MTHTEKPTVAALVEDVLRHNRWRRGDDSLAMPDPKSVGETLDAVCETLLKLERERDHWKRNHDNQVELKRIIAARPDLHDRAPLVERLVKERNDAQQSLVMLAVFRGCMATGTIPAADSACARNVCELLTLLDPTGTLAPEQTETEPPKI